LPGSPSVSTPTALGRVETGRGVHDEVNGEIG
jgi:hypothetical protein